MSESNFGKFMLGIIGGAAVGAALGILFAPAKGTVTRRRIATKTRDLKDEFTNRLEELVESAEEIIDEIKETASEFVHGNEEEEAPKRKLK